MCFDGFDTFVGLSCSPKRTSTFTVKDKSLHQACKGICSCGESYIGETVRNVEVRWGEHNNPTKVSNPSKHIKDNVDHVFHWSVIARAPTNTTTKSAGGILYCFRETYP